MLGYMLPGFSSNNIGDSRTMNTVIGRKDTIGNVALGVSVTDFDNLRPGKPSSAAFLIPHIGCVINGRAKKEVRNADTASVITFVANFHTFWNGAVFHLPGDTVGATRFAVNAYISVALGAFGTSPQPAIARFIDLAPESFSNRSTSTVSIDKAKRLAFGPSLSFVVARCWFSGLTAATFTKVYRGVVRGMIAHVVSSFEAFGQVAGRFQRRCDISIPALDYTTNGRLSLPLGGER